MSESVEIKKGIEVTCLCEECGKELDISCSSDNFGDITCSVCICECALTEDI